jgi:hypothetical protein
VNVFSDVASVSTQRVGIIVLGMHRSGTSAITRVLNIGGAALPASLVGPSVGNETGHWEPRALVDYLDAMLEEIGSPSYDWKKLDFSLFGSNGYGDVKKKISAIVSHEYADARQFVLKDPRLCRLFPIVNEVFQELGISPRIVMPIRNPLEVCKSIERRDNRTRSDAAIFWIRHVLDAEKHTRGLPRSIFTYDELIADWASVYSRLVRELDLPGMRSIEEIQPQIDQFLSPRLRHHSHSTEDVRRDSILGSWGADVWEALLVLRDSAHDDEAKVRLDGIFRLVDQLTPFLLDQRADFVRLKSDWYEPELARLSSALENFEKTKAEWWDPEIKRLSEALQKADERERVSHLPKIAELQENVIEIQNDLMAALKRQSEELEPERLRLSAALAEAERAIDVEHLPSIARLETELQELRERNFHLANEELAAAQREIEQLQQKISELERNAPLHELQRLRRKLGVQIEENMHLSRRNQALREQVEADEKLREGWFQPEIARLSAALEQFEKTKAEWWDPHIAEQKAAISDLTVKAVTFAQYEKSRIYRFSLWYYQLYSKPIIGPVLGAARRTVARARRKIGAKRR